MAIVLAFKKNWQSKEQEVSAPNYTVSYNLFQKILWHTC